MFERLGFAITSEYNRIMSASSLNDYCDECQFIKKCVEKEIFTTLFMKNEF